MEKTAGLQVAIERKCKRVKKRELGSLNNCVQSGREMNAMFKCINPRANGKILKASIVGASLGSGETSWREREYMAAKTIAK